MGGLGSGRPASGKKNMTRLTLAEKIERNRIRARERWQRLRTQTEAQPDLKGQSLYKLHPLVMAYLIQLGKLPIIS